METKDLAALLVKAAGLILFGYAVIRIPAYILPVGDPNAPFSLGALFVQAAVFLALPMLLGLLFWFFPATVTNKMVSGEKLARAQFGLREFERVALTVVGVSIVAYGFADLIHAVALAYFVHSQHPEVTPLPADLYAGIVFPAAKIAIGAGVAVGARGIGKLLARLRGDG
jgi:hypothetical protein